eukprot:gnl/MRDRNA2_/MRDRNA2_111593_c0_seq1.p1 gnl/MRDRNA2_/MRDRNA2_111593_c0~~gnl/MRDRNA2_/MRDRNA2_111593_c0_seq1.p1  ORF type:complete len:1373 (+),score=424.79 gnl/MRDRNA2_/MRDRNA2_111593_c0_seq1:54-4172(+)
MAPIDTMMKGSQGPDETLQNALQAKVASTVSQTGIARKLKSQLRFKLIESLQGQVPLRSSTDEHLGMQERALFSLILDFLRGRGKSYALSVLLPESGMGPDQVLSRQETSHILSLQFADTGDAPQVDGPSLLENLVESLKKFKKPDSFSCGTQTDPDSRRTDLESKLRAIESSPDTAVHENRKTIERRMLQFQARCEAQCRQEMEAEVKRIRTLEREQITMEQAAKSRRDTQERTLELERTFRDKEERLHAREKAALERLQAKEVELEKKAIEWRGEAMRQLDVGSEKQRLRSRELEVEQQRLQAQERAADRRELELKDREERFQTREAQLRAELDSQLRQFQVETEASVADEWRDIRRQQVEVERKVLQIERGQRANEELQGKIEEFKVGGAALREELRRTEEKLAAKSREAVDLTSQLSLLTEAGKQAQITIDRLRGQMTVSEKQVEALKGQQRQGLQEEEHRQKAASDMQVMLQKQLEESRTQIDRLKSELEQARGLSEKMQGEKSDFEARTRLHLEQAWQLERGSLQSELARLQQERADASSVEKRLREDVQRLQEECRAIRIEAEERRVAMMAEIEGAKLNKREKSAKAATEWRAAIRQLEKELASEVELEVATEFKPNRAGFSAARSAPWQQQLQSEAKLLNTSIDAFARGSGNLQPPILAAWQQQLSETHHSGEESKAAAAFIAAMQAQNAAAVAAMDVQHQEQDKVLAATYKGKESTKVEQNGQPNIVAAPKMPLQAAPSKASVLPAGQPQGPVTAAPSVQPQEVPTTKAVAVSVAGSTVHAAATTAAPAAAAAVPTASAIKPTTANQPSLAAQDVSTNGTTAQPQSVDAKPSEKAKPAERTLSDMFCDSESNDESKLPQKQASSDSTSKPIDSLKPPERGLADMFYDSDSSKETPVGRQQASNLSKPVQQTKPPQTSLADMFHDSDSNEEKATAMGSKQAEQVKPAERPLDDMFRDSESDDQKPTAPKSLSPEQVKPPQQRSLNEMFCDSDSGTETPAAPSKSPEQVKPVPLRSLNEMFGDSDSSKDSPAGKEVSTVPPAKQQSAERPKEQQRSLADMFGASDSDEQKEHEPQKKLADVDPGAHIQTQGVPTVTQPSAPVAISPKAKVVVQPAMPDLPTSAKSAVAATAKATVVEQPSPVKTPTRSHITGIGKRRTSSFDDSDGGQTHSSFEDDEVDLGTPTHSHSKTLESSKSLDIGPSNPNKFGMVEISEGSEKDSLSSPKSPSSALKQLPREDGEESEKSAGSGQISAGSGQLSAGSGQISERSAPKSGPSSAGSQSPDAGSAAPAGTSTAVLQPSSLEDKRQREDRMQKLMEDKRQREQAQPAQPPIKRFSPQERSEGEEEDSDLSGHVSFHDSDDAWG